MTEDQFDVLKAIEQKINGLDRKINMLQQDVTMIRTTMSEIAEVGPDVIANREHLLKLERNQGRLEARIEAVERRANQ